MYVYRLASLDSALRQELDAVPSERRYQRMYVHSIAPPSCQIREWWLIPPLLGVSIVLYECMTRFVLPLCDHLPHEPQSSPVCSVMSIIDLADTSLRDMWSLRSHLQQASTLATANYPETLHTIAIVNSPSFFPTVWNWVKVRAPEKALFSNE